jgi:hypothetical protein
MAATTFKEGSEMAGRKKARVPRGRIEFQAPLEWIDRVERQATRLGLNISTYIRLAVTERLERDEAAEPERKPGKK